LQIADTVMSVSRSLALHSKDLVVSETQNGSLTMFTLDFDNNEASTHPHCITQVVVVVVVVVEMNIIKVALSHCCCKTIVQY